MSKHTKGPWTAVGTGGMGDGGSTKYHPHFKGRIVGGDGHSIVSVGNFLGIHGTTPEQAEANARLIAAAPDLLEALREMLDAQICGDCALCDKAKAAIVKAEGK